MPNLAKYLPKFGNTALTFTTHRSMSRDSSITKFKIIGAAAGSLFVFKGKYRAVLISYPNREERKPLY